MAPKGVLHRPAAAAKAKVAAKAASKAVAKAAARAKGKGAKGKGSGMPHRDPVRVVYDTRDLVTVLYDTGGGGHHEFMFESSSDMVEVKRAIIELMGFPVSAADLTLYCGGREMTDDLTFLAIGFGGGRQPPFRWTTEPCLPDF
jgi:hypothetical protein